MKKRSLALILAMAMATTSMAATAFAESSEVPAAEDLNFTFVSPLLSHPIWLTAKEGFEARVKNWELPVTGLVPRVCPLKKWHSWLTRL